MEQPPKILIDNRSESKSIEIRHLKALLKIHTPKMCYGPDIRIYIPLPPPPPPPFRVTVSFSWMVFFFLQGYGEEFGGITCLLTNEHESKTVKIIYFETIPWYVRVYLHTLKVEIEGKVMKPGKHRQELVFLM